MLKKRMVGVLVVKDGIVVQSIGFHKYLPVGSPAIAIEYLNQWGIDEIALLDIDAGAKGRGPLVENIKKYSQHCHVPLAVGGGIKNAEHMKELIHAGADKVIVNTAAVQDLALITEGASLFGNQCIVMSIDAKKISSNEYEVFTASGKTPTGYKPEVLAKKAEESGAGEILLNSIDHDGAKQGYDLDLIQRVTRAVSIPVIVCGGVGHPQHFQEAMKLDVSAVAAANFFHFSEHSVIAAKSFLKGKDESVRLDSYAMYNNFEFDRLGRVSKMNDALLEKLRFEYIPEEKI